MGPDTSVSIDYSIKDFKKYISIYFVSYKLRSSFCHVRLYYTCEALSTSVFHFTSIGVCEGQTYFILIQCK